MVSLRNIRTALAVALLASTALGQIDWGQKPLAPPPGRHGHALVYDAISRRVVLFGGQEGATAPIRLADTWEWNGREWVQRLPTQSPEARSHHAMAYHGSSGSAFLFGGRSANGAPLDDTWTWSSGVWTRKRPALQPPARAEHALCWDRARDVLVVYGGVDAAGMARDDTWTWNGTDWSQVTTNAGPIGNGLTMTFDEARGTCLLFAGSTAETWGFDGVQWTQRMPASSPSARTGQSMAYDSTRHVVVLTGGESTTGVLDDAWEWDGTNWTPRVSAFRPTARTNAAIAYDAARGSMLLFGGRDPINARSAADTWSFDGQTWHAIELVPIERGICTPALAYDTTRRRLVLFRGCGETWEWDGVAWQRMAPATSPPARQGHALVFDAIRGQVVLFGGLSPMGTFLDDTWEWNGITWTERRPATKPDARTGHAFAYDPMRQRTVLCAGQGPAGMLSDTWEWDGTTWTSRQPATRPPARIGSALARDEVSGDLLSFGGMDAAGLPNAETWAWNGTDWRRLSPLVSPPARGYHTLVTDPRRRVIVLFGGMTSCTSFANDTWEWNGFLWTQRSTTHVPESVQSHAAAYDARLRTMMVFGGFELLQTGCLVGERTDLWAYGEVTASVAVRVGSGCLGSRAFPILTPYGRSSVGNPRFGVDLASMLPNAPCALVIGTRLGFSSLGGGCILYVDATSIFDVIGIGANGHGTAHQPLPIPMDHSLMGLDLFLQTLVVDPGGTPGFAMSNGYRMIVGL